MIDGTPLSIGEVAARLNVTVSQVRWLEHQRLVSPQLDADGRRQYLPHVVTFLRFYWSARRLGLTHEEVVRVAESADKHHVPSTASLRDVLAEWREEASRRETAITALMRATDQEHARP